MTGIVVFLAELLGHLEARVGIVLQESQKLFTFHKIDLARVDGLGRQLVRLARNCCAQAEHLTRFGNLQDQRLAVSGTDGKFDPSLA